MNFNEDWDIYQKMIADESGLSDEQKLSICRSSYGNSYLR